MKVIFLQEAEQELVEAALYYERQAQGLGKRFSNEVSDAIANIVDFPLINQKLSKNIRRKLLKRYPFAVLYRLDNECIVITAVMNLKRKPFYWKSRLS